MLRRIPFVLFLTLSVALAGCAQDDPADGAGDADTGADPANDVDAGTPPSDTDGETPDAGDDAAGSEGERWHGFAFDEHVTPRSGNEGTVRSFTSRLSQEEDGETTTYDLKLVVGEVSTMDIRTKRMSFNATGMQEEVVTTSVEVRELQHTITIVQDDTGEHEAGDVLTFRGFTPTDPAQEEATWLLGYARLEWTDANGETGVTEYLAPKEQQDGVIYLPYEEGEGDFSGTWAFSVYSMAYNPLWLAGWSDGSQSFEEGSYSFGGYNYDTTRKTLSVDGYTFDGWRVEWTMNAKDSSAIWMFEVAPELPIPFAYKFGESGSGGDSSSYWTYELRALELG